VNQAALAIQRARGEALVSIKPMKTIGAIVCGLGCVLSCGAAPDVRLEPLASFGPHGDGSLRPGDYPFLTTGDSDYYQRGLAYNPTTGHLILVNRNPADAGFYILDGTSGDHIGNVEYAGFQPGGSERFPISLIGVADDGAIYVGNLSTVSAPPQFRLYRWADEAAPQTVAYAGDPSNGNTNSANRRWGDTMAVRGAGTNTQILIASRGTLVSMLTPLDSTLNTFTSTVIQTDVPTGALGYGLTFGSGNTFYGTAGAQSGGPLSLLQFNLNANLTGTATTLARYGSTLIPNNLTPIGAHPQSNLFAGISTTAQPAPDTVRLYDISAGTNPPAFLDRHDFAHNNTNGVFAGAVVFGGQRLYALDANNGIMAFSIVTTSDTVPPAVILQPANRTATEGSNATFSVSVDGTPPFTYQWRFQGTNVLADQTNLTLTLTNVQPSNAGPYNVVVSNSAGSVTSLNGILTVLTNVTATLLVYEPFNYPAGDSLNGKTLNGAQTWSLNGTGDDTFIVPNSLSLAGLAAPSAQSITNGGAGAAVRLALGASVSGGTLYYSFPMRIDEVGAAFTSTTAFIASFVNQGANSQEARLSIKSASGGYNLGVTKVTSAEAVYAPTLFGNGEVVFIVMSYTFRAGTATDDEVNLWINPEPATFGATNEPAPTLRATTNGADIVSIDRFAFRQNTSANTPAVMTFDELRIGTTWASVTPSSIVPRPVLSIRREGASIVLSWPESAGGFVLEGTFSLSPISWEQIFATVVTENGTNSVTLSAEDVHGFFRLRQ